MSCKISEVLGDYIICDSLIFICVYIYMCDISDDTIARGNARAFQLVFLYYIICLEVMVRFSLSGFTPT